MTLLLTIIIVVFTLDAGGVHSRHDDDGAGTDGVRTANGATGSSPAARARSPPPRRPSGSAPRRGPLSTDLPIHRPILAPGPSPTERSTPPTTLTPRGNTRTITQEDATLRHREFR